MRAWPYQMLNVLPYHQLLSQWRECLAISGMIYGDGTNVSLENINHATINRIKDYTIEHFVVYCDLVRKAFLEREWTIGTNTIEKLNNEIDFENILSKIDIKEKDGNYYVNGESLFGNYHNKRHIKQCLYSFQEKYDVGMITDDQWNKLKDKFNDIVL